MKKIIALCIVLICVRAMLTAQCGVFYQETLQKYCRGTYLLHQELKSDSAGKIAMVLKKEYTYSVYFLNPSAAINVAIFTGEGNEIFNDYKKTEDAVENYSVFIFTPEKTQVYLFTVDFAGKQNECVLMAVYIQDDKTLVPGIYKSFEEMRDNSPSVGLTTDYRTRTQKFQSAPITSYLLNISREEGKTIGNVFGFCDGERIFINDNSPKLRPGTEFAETEKIGRFSYYSYLEYTPITVGSGVVVSTSLIQKIMDSETGEIVILRPKNIRQIISDNPELLEQFNNDPKKYKKMKEYLIRYTEESQ
jgi:hypothetical protein